MRMLVWVGILLAVLCAVEAPVLLYPVLRYDR